MRFCLVAVMKHTQYYQEKTSVSRTPHSRPSFPCFPACHQNNGPSTEVYGSDKNSCQPNRMNHINQIPKQKWQRMNYEPYSSSSAERSVKGHCPLPRTPPGLVSSSHVFTRADCEGCLDTSYTKFAISCFWLFQSETIPFCMGLLQNIPSQAVTFLKSREILSIQNIFMLLYLKLEMTSRFQKSSLTKQWLFVTSTLFTFSRKNFKIWECSTSWKMQFSHSEKFLVNIWKRKRVYFPQENCFRR